VLLLTACVTPLGQPPVTPRASAGPPLQVQGHVFDDRDRDGVRGEGEPGIPGVAVSNGVDVVVTDETGLYTLTIQGDAVVFVVKPGGWATPIDADGLPLFYYNHKPHGSPDEYYRFPGVDPTGPLPDAIDFPLTESEEPPGFDVVVFSDPQPYTMEQMGHFARTIVADLAGVDAAFGISLGDLVGDDLSLFDPLNKTQGLLGIPWYNVIGNHDHNYMSSDDEYADESYERVYGPPTYAFQYSGVHFIVLDDVLWLGFDGWEGANLPDNDHYRGGLRQDQLRFVENYLAIVPREHLVVLAMHVPFAKGAAPQIVEQPALLALLSSHPHTVSISGHSHRQAHTFFAEQEGYAPDGGGEHHHMNLGAASGSWYRGPPDPTGLPEATMRDGTPPGYTILRFEGASYSARYQVARRSPDYQMNIHVPFEVLRETLSTTEVVVNVFAGSARSTVRMRIAGSAWIPLRRELRVDPFYQDALDRAAWSSAWRELPPPNRSTHIWTGMLPGTVPSGTHWLEVESRDVFGQLHRATVPLRIE
jgi:hypothetical protein